jgi:hypothetical protein
MTKAQKIGMWIVIIVAVLLLCRFVIFKKQFDAWGEGLQRIGSWQDQYKKDHPEATKEEMDAAFKTGVDNIAVWKSQYKQEHPQATNAEADAAFDAAWKK